MTLNDWYLKSKRVKKIYLDLNIELRLKDIWHYNITTLQVHLNVHHKKKINSKTADSVWMCVYVCVLATVHQTATETAPEWWI